MTTIYENHLFRLRKAHINDAEELLNTSSNEEVMKYYGMNPCKDMQGAGKEIAWFNSLIEDGKGVRWVIADVNSNLYIGDIGVFGLDPDHSRIEIGFKLKKEYWNLGIMRKCIQKILAFSFLKKGYNRIEAFVDPRNIGCQMTLKRNGFQLEGTLREYELERGQYVDLQLYSILKKEYLQ